MEGCVSLFDDNETEAAYYSFRAMVTRGSTDGVTMLGTLSPAHFDALFPVLDSSLLQRLWNVLFQRPDVNFEQFMRAMSNHLRRPRKCRLSVIYGILVGSRDEPLTAEEGIDFVGAHLCDSLSFLGYDNYGSLSDWMVALWGDSSDHVERPPLDYGEFVKKCAALPNNHVVYDFFGLFSYLEHIVLGRAEHRAAQKEGFLRKSYGQRELKKNHWSCVRDGFFWYYDVDELTFETPSRVLTLSKDSVVEPLSGSEDGFSLRVRDYQRDFYCETAAEASHWIQCIRQNVAVSEAPALHAGITCRWMVDGVAFFSEVRKALLWAKREIFITGWFLSAHVYLNGIADDSSRLDNILRARAEAGVKIYVLMWNETKILDLNSRYTELYLESLHRNIRVMRHPIVRPMIWTHHQKSVVVDQCVAFVGGLDLTFGRMDDVMHVCTDPERLRWKGKDFYNPRHANITLVDTPFDDLIDRKTKCRMPWHDVHVVCDGAVAQDVARNFINRWNHHKLDLSKVTFFFFSFFFFSCSLFQYHKDALYPYLTPAPQSVTRRGTMKTRMVRSAGPWSIGFNDTSMYDSMLLAISEAEAFIYIENQFFISCTAGPEVQNKIADALLTRISEAMAKKDVFRVIVLVPIHPEGSIDDPAVRNVLYWHQVRSVFFFSFFLSPSVFFLTTTTY